MELEDIFKELNKGMRHMSIDELVKLRNAVDDLNDADSDKFWASPMAHSFGMLTDMAKIEKKKQGNK